MKDSGLSIRIGHWTNEIYLQLPLFMQNAARIENCVQTLAQTVAAQTTEISSIEQIVGSLLARVSTLEAGAASCSSGPDSARSWNFLGHSDGSPATGSLGSHGPGSPDDKRNTRRRLDTFSSPEDEHDRSAVLPHFPCQQFHAGVSTWLEKFWATTNAPAFHKPIRIHCKTGSLYARLVFETRAKCQDFVARYMDGIPYAVDSPLCSISTNITVRQSKLQEIFPERDAKETFIVRTLRPFTNPQHFGPQERGGETSFQPCTTVTRTVV